MAVIFWKAWDGQLVDCHIGAWGEAHPATEYGYFKTGVYINGSGSGTNDPEGFKDRCVRIRVEGNEIHRNPGIDDLPADHGLYALGVYDLYLGYNIISGWPLRLDGGALKLRDGDRFHVEQNLMQRSGLLLYEYEANKPHHLKDVLVKGNVVRTWVTPGPEDRATGITYWRNWDGGTETAIRIEGNHVYGGELRLHDPVSTAGWNAGPGGLFRNKASQPGWPEGIRAEENVQLTESGPEPEILTRDFRERIANRRPWEWERLADFFAELWEEWPETTDVRFAAPH